ncbi:helix-turn-helix transcriptional regulator [Paenibacillus silviterrae]|uniref:helix-turn-helix transcriptional regulator n=1 Tax=Paenibacillus silviterrae TaxID=3242194 RepID=UPI002542D7AE|nr:AraC family transcriptional regulator [Paenibacillus chinjuensis]
MLQMNSVHYHKGSSWYEEADSGAETWQLVLMCYGKCVYWFGQQKLVLGKGDLLLIPPHTVFYGKSIPTVSHEKYAAAFLPQESAIALPMLLGTDPLHFRTGMFELLHERFRSLHAEAQHANVYSGTMCVAILLELLAHANREADRSLAQSNSVKHRHVEQMKGYIQNHYREKITKDNLGAVIEKSPNHAAAVFSEVTGQTIGEFTYALRVKTAVYLLQHSQMTVQDIADYLGFCDSSYFHRVFKRHTGRTPSYYLKDREPPVY